MVGIRQVIGAGLALWFGACSSVEPLVCDGTPYFHLDEDGLPVCGVATSPDVETWEIEDWPDRSSEVMVLSSGADVTLFGRLEVSSVRESCEDDVDRFRFALGPGEPRFVEAQVRVTLDAAIPDYLAELWLASETISSGAIFFGPGVEIRAPLLLFAPPNAEVGPAELSVQWAYPGACPPRPLGYRLEVELQGEAAAVALGRPAAGAPASRRVDAPAGVQLYSVEAGPGVRLEARCWMLSAPEQITGPDLLSVGADGTVSYVDEEAWNAITEPIRYFLVRSNQVPYEVEVTLGT